MCHNVSFINRTKPHMELEVSLNFVSPSNEKHEIAKSRNMLSDDAWKYSMLIKEGGGSSSIFNTTNYSSSFIYSREEMAASIFASIYGPDGSGWVQEQTQAQALWTSWHWFWGSTQCIHHMCQWRYTISCSVPKTATPLSLQESL